MRDALRNARAAALLLRGSARFAAAWALEAAGSRHAEAMGLRGLDDGLDAFELLGASAIAAYLRTMDPRPEHPIGSRGPPCPDCCIPTVRGGILAYTRHVLGAVAPDRWECRSCGRVVPDDAGDAPRFAVGRWPS